MHEKSAENIRISNDETLYLDSISSELMELEIIVKPEDLDRLNIELCASPDDREKTLIAYNCKNKTLEIDTRKSSLHYGKKLIERAPLELKPDENLKVRIFIDKSIIEVYAKRKF